MKKLGEGRIRNYLHIGTNDFLFAQWDPSFKYGCGIQVLDILMINCSSIGKSQEFVPESKKITGHGLYIYFQIFNTKSNKKRCI